MLVTRRFIVAQAILWTGVILLQWAIQIMDVPEALTAEGKAVLFAGFLAGAQAILLLAVAGIAGGEIARVLRSRRPTATEGQ